MATKSMTFDHPAYLAVSGQFFSIAAGSAAKSSPKFTAFTMSQIKAVVVKADSASSTSADVLSLIGISGTATSTWSLGTYGSAATTFSYLLPTSTTTATYTNTGNGGTIITTLPVAIQGDTFYVVKGTDATVNYQGVMEFDLIPTANVTAPASPLE